MRTVCAMYMRALDCIHKPSCAGSWPLKIARLLQQLCFCTMVFCLFWRSVETKYLDRGFLDHVLVACSHALSRFPLLSENLYSTPPLA